MAKTKWQQLQTAKKKLCEGKIKTADFNKKAKAYVDDAVKKGKKKSEATASVNKLKRKSCKVKAKAKVSGTSRKRKPNKRKTTRRARK